MRKKVKPQIIVIRDKNSGCSGCFTLIALCLLAFFVLAVIGQFGEPKKYTPSSSSSSTKELSRSSTLTSDEIIEIIHNAVRAELGDRTRIEFPDRDYDVYFDSDNVAEMRGPVRFRGGLGKQYEKRWLVRVEIPMMSEQSIKHVRIDW